MAMNGHWLIMEFVSREILTEYILTGLFAMGNMIQNSTKWKAAALETCVSILCELLMRMKDPYVQSEIFNILVKISLKKIRHVMQHANDDFLRMMVSNGTDV